MTELAALTNAITDITVRVTDDELVAMGLQKGFYNAKADICYEKFLNMISDREVSAAPGGSPANVCFDASYLGLATALFGTVGVDRYGQDYIKQLKKSGIQSLLSVSKGDSGLCYVLVTPDCEKSSIATIGVTGKYDFDLKRLKSAKVFHTSGYELFTNRDRTLETIEYCHKLGAEISYDLADPGCIEKRTIEGLLAKIDILFMTEEESTALTSSSPRESLQELAEICSTVVLKKGKKGSVVRQKNEEFSIPTYPCRLVSTVGAGDAYATGFLFAHLRNFELNECGHFASFFASRVCSIDKSHF